jgi:hypothetical protein
MRQGKEIAIIEPVNPTLLTSDLFRNVERYTNNLTQKAVSHFKSKHVFHMTGRAQQKMINW